MCQKEISPHRTQLNSTRDGGTTPDSFDANYTEYYGYGSTRGKGRYGASSEGAVWLDAEFGHKPCRHRLV